MSQVPKPNFTIDPPKRSRWKIINVSGRSDRCDEEFHHMLQYYGIDENNIKSIQVIQKPDWEINVPLMLLVNYIK